MRRHAIKRNTPERDEVTITKDGFGNLNMGVEVWELRKRKEMMNEDNKQKEGATGHDQRTTTNEGHTRKSTLGQDDTQARERRETKID